MYERISGHNRPHVSFAQQFARLQLQLTQLQLRRWLVAQSKIVLGVQARAVQYTKCAGKSMLVDRSRRVQPEEHLNIEMLVPVNVYRRLPEAANVLFRKVACGKEPFGDALDGYRRVDGGSYERACCNVGERIDLKITLAPTPRHLIA